VTAYVAKLLIDAVVRAIAANATPGTAPPLVTFGPLTLDPVGTVILLAIAQFVIYASS
jgi:hypothetical protein